LAFGPPAAAAAELLRGAPPGSLLDGQLITRAVSYPVSLATLQQQGLFISEHAHQVKTTVNGLTTARAASAARTAPTATSLS